MPALTNPRWEAFAEEVAKGTSAARAYELVGYAANRHNASALARRQPVAARVMELRRARDQAITAQAVTALTLDRSRVVGMLVDQYRAATNAGQTSAAIRAAELLGKEIGMFRDKQDLNIMSDPATWSSEQLRAVAARLELEMKEETEA